MTASIVPNAKNQFVDINGAPLVGGKVYMYTINSLIFKDTWQDAEQQVLNLNPIILDSRGQAIIYGVGSYRQILTDAADNLIWDKDIEDFQASVFGPQVTLVSHTTTDLGTASANNVLITGTTTINSFGTSASLANPVYLLQFAGILTITYNATSMILPGATNVTTAAGDSALVEFTNTAGYWRMIAYFSNATPAVLGTAAVKNIGTSGANVPLLNGGNSWSGVQSFAAGTNSPEVTINNQGGGYFPNFARGSNFFISIPANSTMENPSNVQPGQSGVFRVLQTNAGISFTWDTAYKAAGGIASVNLSGVNGAVDYFAYYAHSASEIVVTPLLNIS